MRRSFLPGLLAFVLLAACSSEVTPAPATDAAVDSGVAADTATTLDTLDTGVAADTATTTDGGSLAECDLVAQDCPSGQRCVETRVGTECGSKCFGDKPGTGTQGATCATPDDCAKGFACIKVGDAGYQCARYCDGVVMCASGSTCQKLSNCSIGAWPGRMCY